MQTRWIWLVGAAILFALAFVLSGYWGDIYRKLLLVAALCVSFNFLFGVSGQLAFSHIAFYGLGAYSVVILTFNLSIPLPLAILGTLGICLVISLAVAIPATRLSGFYLALATLAFAQVFKVLLDQGGDLTGGPEGLTGYRASGYFGLPSTMTVYTCVVVAVFLATLWVILRLDSSWFGRACRAVRDNEGAAAAMGINVISIKVVAFVATSMLASIAGITYAFVDNYLNPAVFELEPMFLLLFMAVIGGTGRTSGAILGSVLLFLAPNFLEEWVGRHYVLAYGVVVLVVILFLPRGLIMLVDNLRQRYRGTAAP